MKSRTAIGAAMALAVSSVAYLRNVFTSGSTEQHRQYYDPSKKKQPRRPEMSRSYLVKPNEMRRAKRRWMRETGGSARQWVKLRKRMQRLARARGRVNA